MPSQIGAVAPEPIKAAYVLSSQATTPQMIRTPEAATQTFQIGVPITIVAGFAQECTFVGADVVFGVSSEKAHNYTNAGGGASFGLPPIFPASIDLNEPASGPAPNQPNSVVVPIGAALRDGLLGTYGANGQTVFSIALKPGQVFTQALLVPNTFYKLLKDASGFWVLDTTVTAGNAAVAQLLDVDHSCPNDAVLGSRVFFQFKSTQRAF